MRSATTLDLDAIDRFHPAPPDLARRQASARQILAWGLTGGVAGDALLRTSSIGINVAACLLLMVAAVVSLSRRRYGGLRHGQREPLLAAVVFALLLALRDAPMLAAWNIASSLGALAFAAAMATPDPLAPLGRLSVSAAIAHVARLVPEGVLGAFPFLAHEAPLAVAGHHRHLLAARLVARALVVALVVGGVLLALLRAGDAVFARATDALVTWDPAALALHVLFSVLFAWPIIGWLHRWSSFNAAAPRRRLASPSLDTTAILAIMNAVFVAFLAVQVRVLFGGQAYVQSVTGLTLAEYARSGFFALVGATAFVLVVLLALDGTAALGSLAAVPRHRRLGASLVGMVALLLGSAVVRMWLYMQAFGLSTDRLYAMVAMAWITVALVGFAWTVLRGRAQSFTAVAVRSGWGILLLLNVANPAAIVTQANATRASEGAAFDLSYHESLAADAVPALVEVLLRPSAEAVGTRTPACEVASRLLERYGPQHDATALTWNAARARARDVVARRAPELQALSCPSAPQDRSRR